MAGKFYLFLSFFVSSSSIYVLILFSKLNEEFLTLNPLPDD
jgi:hypothetical protein